MPGLVVNPMPSPFVPLEDVDPGKFTFAVSVRAREVTPQILTALVPQTTTYREFGLLRGMENMRANEAAGTDKTLGDDWVYTHHQGADGGTHTFFFSAIRTDLERQTAIPALSYTTCELYAWPDVVHRLWFVEDPDMPMEVVVDGQAKYVPRYFKRLEMTEGGSLPSLVRVRVYASHKPFPESFFKLDVPVPGSISWDMRNTTGSLPRCLHPHMEFPESQPSGRLVFGAGTVGQTVSFGQKTVFPATNHADWRDHVYLEQVQQVRGVYMLEQREVIVPRGRRRLKNVA